MVGIFSFLKILLEMSGNFRFIGLKLSFEQFVVCYVIKMTTAKHLLFATSDLKLNRNYVHNYNKVQSILFRYTHF